MWKSGTRTLSVTGIALTCALSAAPAFAGEGGGGTGGGSSSSTGSGGSSLSDTETAYTGAIMLKGGQEVTMDSVVLGSVGDDGYLADGRYGYFAGNTLYAGSVDDLGNSVDLIAEFFWFESSIDRGSDFYVAVVKARTSPNLSPWVLERKTDDFLGVFLPDNEATLYVQAQTDLAPATGAFRWDWSIPFDSYGWDQYGNITMETKYGIDASAEGSVQKAVKLDGPVPVETTVQAKGYFNTKYQVQTKYEITLYRWEVVVHGTAGQIDWQMNLHTKDRESQNAYHEFFIVMQSEQGVPFHLDWLEVGGSVKKPIWWWFDEHRSLSAGVTGITLYPPELPPSPPDESGSGAGGGEPIDEPVDDSDDSGDGADPNGNESQPIAGGAQGCAVSRWAPVALPPWELLVALIALAGRHELGRRRRAPRHRSGRRLGPASLAIASVALAAGCTSATADDAGSADAICGNGVVEAVEECDDGNSSDGDECLSSCARARCGDGQLQQGIEICDDGNVDDLDACSADCRDGGAGRCGNGADDPGEECDDGNAQNIDGCVGDCKLARCGDGYAELLVEECDDGNGLDDDGCRNDCTLLSDAALDCPGLALQVALKTDTAVVGDTAGSEDDDAGGCGGVGATDVVYSVEPQADGWLVATVTGYGGFDPVLYVRGSGCDAGPELACASATAKNGSELAILQVLQGQRYFVFVDGAAAPGHFLLELHLQTEVPGDSCPGVALALAGGSDLVMTADTSIATSDYKGGSACGSSIATKDLVYAVTATQDGLLTATLAPQFDGQLYARVGSCTVGNQIACSEAGGAGGTETLSWNAVAGTKYSVLVDGKNGAAGAFTLNLHLQP